MLELKVLLSDCTRPLARVFIISNVIVVLSFIALTLVAGEIQFGLVAVLLDPFVASIFLFLLIITMIPFHTSGLSTV
jgi:hypothetical protein